MAKYIGSPWGYLRGKLNDAVGGVWKGIEWTRVRVLPRQRGTIDLWRRMMAGRIRPLLFSYKQFNIRRLVFQLLGWLGRANLECLMYPVWQRLCDLRKYKLTHINLFVLRNAPALWASIPNKDQIYSITNKPNMDFMLVSDGDLEPTPSITGCTYNPATGALTITWDATHVKNGTDTDLAYIMAYVEPVVDISWRPEGYLYGTALTSVGTRVAGTGTITIAAGLTPSAIHGYVFFRDAANLIGYSPSVAATAT
ncbi:MAG: hypothetical protein QMD71_09960 [bacterium]|nr:hypothetical protein [bacterium]